MVVIACCGYSDQSSRREKIVATPLEVAVYENDPDRVRTQLSKASPTQVFRTHNGPNLLYWVLSDQIFVKRRSEPADQVVRKADEILILLLDSGMDFESPSSIGQSAIFTAIDYNRVAAVRELVRRGASLSTRDTLGATPLERAIDDCRVEIVQVLFRKDSNSVRSASRKSDLLDRARRRCPAAMHTLSADPFGPS